MQRRPHHSPIVWTLSVLLGLAAAGCESSAPTVPIPPPAALTSVDEDGFATLSGMGAEPEALVFAYNEDREAGVIDRAENDGTFVVRIGADIGDTITYWQRVGTVDSALQSAVVPEP